MRDSIAAVIEFYSPLGFISCCAVLPPSLPWALEHGRPHKAANRLRWGVGASHPWRRARRGDTPAVNQLPKFGASHLFRMTHARHPFPIELAEDSSDADASDTRATRRIAPEVTAFGTLVRDHVDFIWRSLKRLGVPPADVDDATQQVFLIASEKMAIIRPGSERAFLLAVAGRVASHARRADQRRRAAQQKLSEIPPPPAAPDPEHLTQNLQARDLLDQVLDYMPDEVRAVFVLFELEELSITEVARLLGIPRGTAATRLRRGRIIFHERAQFLQRCRGGSP